MSAKTGDSAEFSALLRTTDLDPKQIERLVAFREDVLLEDETQNLTRLLSPRDFFEGHIVDVLELERSGLLRTPALDLGAGMGVPGILHQLVYAKTAEKGDFAWISSDSERMKADFSQRMITNHAIPAALSVGVRAEAYLDNHSVEMVVARAVGPVARIYNWIRNCSTWNSMLLFKGPKWEEEWSEFQKTGQRNQLSIARIHEYRVGAEEKQRKIILLHRK